MSTIKNIVRYLGRRTGRSFNHRIQFGFDTFLATSCGCRCGRRCPAALDLFTSSRPVLVVGMFLQVDHAQPLGFFHVWPSVLRCQAFPLLACNKRKDEIRKVRSCVMLSCTQCHITCRRQTVQKHFQHRLDLNCLIKYISRKKVIN